MKVRIRIPLSWRRVQRYSPATDYFEPMRRVFFLNISTDDKIFFAGCCRHLSQWGKAYTIRFGVGYA